MISSRFPSLGSLFDGSGSRTTKTLGNMLERNWYLGLTSFGGPAVHFQIVREAKVDPCTIATVANSEIVSPHVCREIQMD